MQPQPAEPADFAAFWRDVRRGTEDVQTIMQVAAEGTLGSHRVSRITWTQRDGIHVGGWLTEPADAPTCAVVVGHGYGGRTAPDTGWLPRGAVGLFPCMPGFDRSADSAIPGEADGHVVHRIDDRDRYILRACVEATWRAFDALAVRHPSLPLGYAGSSFGGGLGALMLPWEPRCRAAVLEVPTFGNHPLRLGIPCTGSGEAVRRHHARHPEVTGVLAYYDAAVAARRIACPVLVAPADADPAVPPPGQWSVAEAIPGATIYRLSAGHPTPSAEAARFRRAARAFLSARLAGGSASP